MRDVLEAVARGELTPEAAEAELRGYATTESGRFDAAREGRRGIPEAILAEGKTPDEVADLSTTALETTGRAVVTRAGRDVVEAVRTAVVDGGHDADFDRDARARTLVVREDGGEPPEVDATVAVVSAGTADAAAAGEAAVIAREIGARVERVDDVGVANLTRFVDVLDDVRAADVVVVAAGREGALPTVVAGLVDAPVIGLPVSSGYGVGGDGEAALYGMLQSCTVLSVVNVDAGFVAGAQAGLVARAADAGRRTDS
ncbi:nickel pincer cofactor biosynthesis protein LarB [Halobium salinum]|uniref:Nickel pincer cofactor biosynthesis protein LarB n=1 Tax=Halobium salinum TaxID=1364940 RepID=A0ABD5PGC4_9EURY|nr:nickel pincer cofactor biosynthesis protein LarB [Halobium salinum]